MIEIVKSNNQDIRCLCCNKKDDVQIIMLHQSKSQMMIPLCKKCREQLENILKGEI